MFRPASRLIGHSSAVRAVPRVAPTRRFLSTAPPTQKLRSWKSSVVRWGIAAGIIYYFQTSDVFAEEPAYATHRLPETDDGTEQLQTIETLAKERQQRKADAAATENVASEGGQGSPDAGGVEQLEEEADQQGAFNPETGEINWDCPCLGGMAHGPCGDEFKAAFSCFVHSAEEPKGIDCIDRFRDMQNCFREYPEVYGAELDANDDDDVTADGDEPAPAPTAVSESAQPNAEKVAQDESSPSERQAQKERVKAATEQVKKEHEPLSESDTVVPKAWHEDTSNNEDKN